jgi:putative hydrolase of the HAD superfamily
VVSGEVGVGKPDPRIFDLALRLLGASPEEAVMVGDNPTRDVAGAKAAGVTAVWVNRAGLPLAAGAAVPDVEVASLRGLVELLETNRDANNA